MPNVRAGALRPVLIALLIVACLLLTKELDDDPRRQGQAASLVAPATTPEMRLQFGRGRLTLVVTTTSPQHEAALRDLLGAHFANSHTETDIRDGLLMPPDWELVTTRLLDIAASTHSARIDASDNSIYIRATTDNLENYQSRVTSLQDALNADYLFNAEVTAADSEATLDKLCARNFAAITARTGGTQQALQFRQSSIALGESAHALLDKLAEFAYDCQNAQIAIVGHTDSTGTEPWNVQVSEARAQAVAVQLMQRGIAEDRLLVEGRGSLSPVADNDSVQGRARNRRIEFELR